VHGARQHQPDHRADAEAESTKHVGPLVDEALHHALVRHGAAGERHGAACAFRCPFIGIARRLPPA